MEFKIYVILLVLILVLISSVEAASFTGGNIVAYRIVSSTAALAPVNIDEYNPITRQKAQTIVMPTVATGTKLTGSGSATSEGYLTLSVDGKYLIVPGYDGATGTTVITTIQRAVGVIGSNGVPVITKMGATVTGATIRSAASTDGTSLWYSGSGSASIYGLFYTPKSSASPAAGISKADLRALQIFNGNLYISSGTAPYMGINVVSGLPTTGDQTVTNVAASSGSPHAFGFFDSLTMYVADDGTTATTGGIQKWTRATTSDSFTMASRIYTTNPVRGLTVLRSNDKPLIYATTAPATGTNSIIRVVDNGSASPNISIIVQNSPSNNAFRGVALVPVPVFQLTVTIAGGQSCDSVMFTFQEYDYCSTFKATTDTITWTSSQNSSDANKCDIRVYTVSGNQLYKWTLSAPSGVSIAGFPLVGSFSVYSSLKTTASSSVLTCAPEYCSGSNYVSTCDNSSPYETFADVSDVSSSSVTSFLLRTGVPPVNICRAVGICCAATC